MGKKKSEDPAALDAELDAETARDIADLTKQAEDAFAEPSGPPDGWQAEPAQPPPESNPTTRFMQASEPDHGDKLSAEGWDTVAALGNARVRLLQLEQRCMAGPEGCSLADIRGLLDIVGR
jgi:hypothetical protein